MKLNQEQVLQVLSTEKIANDNTGVYTIHFNKLLEKLSLSANDKDTIEALYNNTINNEKSHLIKVSEILADKIESFSHDFWELFFFRKHAYHSQYKDKKWNEFNESYESVKDVKKRVKVLKSLNINNKELEIFLKQLTYSQDGYIDLWFSLKRKNKDLVLEDDMKEMILKYGNIDSNDVQKAVMLSYFKEVNELEHIYNKNKDTPYRRDIEEEILKFKKIDNENMELFDEMSFHSIIYRKNININENALIYELKQEKSIVEQIVKVIKDFLINEIYDIKIEKMENKYIVLIESYSEEKMIENMEQVKKAFKHLPNLLIKKEYNNLIKDSFNINGEVQQFFRQYIKSADLHKNLEEKLPQQNIKEKKNKI